MAKTYEESGVAYEEAGVAYDGAITVSIKNPFDATADVTQSSNSGHGTPYGGNKSCDADVTGASRGAAVKFRLTPGSAVVRGVVDQIQRACASGVLADGGDRVRVRIEVLEGGSWVSSGKWVHYAHLDPVSVAVNDVVTDGTTLGQLGPATAQAWPVGSWEPDERPCFNDNGHDPMGSAPEPDLYTEYHSSCACHSHVHVEGQSADAVSSTTTNGGLSSGAEIMTLSL